MNTPNLRPLLVITLVALSACTLGCKRDRQGQPRLPPEHEIDYKIGYEPGRGPYVEVQGRIRLHSVDTSELPECGDLHVEFVPDSAALSEPTVETLRTFDAGGNLLYQDEFHGDLAGFDLAPRMDEIRRRFPDGGTLAFEYERVVRVYGATSVKDLDPNGTLELNCSGELIELPAGFDKIK